MPPAPKISAEYQELITELIYVHQFGIQNVIDHLGTHHGLQVSRRTLQRRMDDWGININQSWQALDTVDLRLRINALWYGSCLAESELLHVIQAEGIYNHLNHEYTRKAVF